MKPLFLLVGTLVLPVLFITGCPITDGQGTCEYGGELFAVDETFPAADGCNGCNCEVDGKVFCTELACNGIPLGPSDLESEGCSSDDDCRLADTNFQCSICFYGADYALDRYVAATKDSYEIVFQNWLESECPDFAACRAADWKPYEDCEEFMRCNDVEPNILHPEIKAACIDGVCEKGEF